MVASVGQEKIVGTVLVSASPCLLILVGKRLKFNMRSLCSGRRQFNRCHFNCCVLYLEDDGRQLEEKAHVDQVKTKQSEKIVNDQYHNYNRLRP